MSKDKSEMIINAARAAEMSLAHKRSQVRDYRPDEWEFWDRAFFSTLSGLAAKDEVVDIAGDHGVHMVNTRPPGNVVARAVDLADVAVAYANRVGRLKAEAEQPRVGSTAEPTPLGADSELEELREKLAASERRNAHLQGILDMQCEPRPL